jgi:hypothetical protein
LALIEKSNEKIFPIREKRMGTVLDFVTLEEPGMDCKNVNAF